MDGIIIVGNSTINKLGARIDSFDTVVRLNAPKLDHHAGTKTDVHIIGRAELLQTPLLGTKAIYTMFDENTPERRYSVLLKQQEYPQLKMIPDCLRSFGGAISNSPSIASTGFCAILFYLQQYKRVWITGFDFAGQKQDYNWKGERQMVATWIKWGRVRELGKETPLEVLGQTAS